jgi:hypothetical protein
MKVQWTRRALSDLARRSDFRAPVNRETAAPSHLTDHPRLGERLEEFTPRDPTHSLRVH